MKKGISLLLVVVLIFSLGGCAKAYPDPTNPSTAPESSGPTETPQPDEFVRPEGYVATILVSINPQFLLYMGEEGEVLAVEPVNEDAKAMGEHVSGESGAIEKVIENLIRITNSAGYFTQEQKVTLSVESSEIADSEMAEVIGRLAFVSTNTQTDIVVHTHSYEEATCVLPASCSCGATKEEPLGHVWGKWEITKEPSEKEEGSAERTCSACAQTDIRILKRVDPNHTHTYEKTVTAPNCTEKGYTTFRCSGCEDAYTDGELPATGHSYQEEVIAPSCRDRGCTNHTCTVCGDHYKDQITAATGHSWGEWETVKAPTETEEGVCRRACAACPVQETRTLPKTESGHVHSYTEVVTAPTCVQKGFTTFTCACGDSYQGDETPATGRHAYDNAGVCADCGQTRKMELEFTRSSDGQYYIVTGFGSWKGSAIVIPEEYNGLPVREIGHHAFYFREEVNSITIPSSIVKIGPYAFSNYFESVYISSLEAWCHIDFADNPLAYNNGGAKLYINGQLATDITIPESVTTICEGLFQNCSSLTSVTVPDSVKTIEKGAFYGCTGLQSIQLPSSVKTIPDNCFYWCTSLRDIVFPDSITAIGDGAFLGCTALTDITLPEHLAVIGGNAFTQCSGLSAVTIPGSVSLIDASAFMRCGGLTSVTIEEGVAQIGDYAFYECTGLTSITLPSSLTQIGSEIFFGCTGLRELTVTPGNPVYHSAGNCLINTENKTLLVGCRGSVIPTDGSVTYICSRAFYGCTGLDQIQIPAAVTDIEWGAFSGCTGLSSVVLPTALTQIGTQLFENCTGLTSVTIPVTVTSISYSAFLGCTRLTQIHYQGTMAQWEAIQKLDNWDQDTGAYTVYCTDGVLTK